MTWWASGDARQPVGPQGQELARRPDRRLLGKTRAGTGPAPSQNIIRAQIIIISGTGAVTGLFEYSGTPALGNPPIAYIAAPGVTHDPFGNTLPATTGGFVTTSGTSFAQLLGFALTFSAPGETNNAIVSGSGSALLLASATTAALPVQAIVNLNPAAAAPASMQLAANVQIQFQSDTTIARTAAGQVTIGSTLIVGTVLTNLLELTEQAVPAATTSVQAIGNTSGHAEIVSDTTHGDGNSYDIERLTLIAAATTINSSTVRVNVFSKHLGVGTYKIRLWLVTQNTTAADGAAWSFAFSGTLAGSGNLVDFESKTTGTAVVGYAASSTATTTFNGQGVGGNQQLLARATLVVTAAGTLTFGGLELVSGNTVTVSAGGQLEISPVVAT